MDDSGTTFVITGGNSGLGLETARRIAAASPSNRIILGCRDASRALEAQRSIVASTGNARVETLALDLASLASVREFAARLPVSVDVVVCNAGIASGPTRTTDDIDAVFETNHLGHFLLVSLLLDRIPAAGRVIAVSSDMHRPPGPRLRWPGADVLAAPVQPLEVRLRRYSYSKLCNLYFVYELTRRLRGDGSAIHAAAFNPGLMTTTNFTSVPRAIGALMRRVFAARLGDLDRSSRALGELAMTGGAEIDGGYFDRTAASPSASSPISYDLANARDLWNVSDRLTSLGAQ